MKAMKYLGEHWKEPIYVGLLVAAALGARELIKPKIYDAEIKRSFNRVQMTLEDLQFSPAREEDKMIFFNFRKDGDFDRISVRTKAGEFQGKAGEAFGVGLDREEFDYYINRIPFSIGIKEEKKKDGSYSVLSEYKGVIK